MRIGIDFPLLRRLPFEIALRLGIKVVREAERRSHFGKVTLLESRILLILQVFSDIGNAKTFLNKLQLRRKEIASVVSFFSGDF